MVMPLCTFCVRVKIAFEEREMNGLSMLSLGTHFASLSWRIATPPEEVVSITRAILLATGVRCAQSAPNREAIDASDTSRSFSRVRCVFRASREPHATLDSRFFFLVFAVTRKHTKSERNASDDTHPKFVSLAPTFDAHHRAYRTKTRAFERHEMPSSRVSRPTRAMRYAMVLKRLEPAQSDDCFVLSS